MIPIEDLSPKDALAVLRAFAAYTDQRLQLKSAPPQPPPGALGQLTNSLRQALPASTDRPAPGEDIELRIAPAALRLLARDPAHRATIERLIDRYLAGELDEAGYREGRIRKTILTIGAVLFALGTRIHVSGGEAEPWRFEFIHEPMSEDALVEVAEGFLGLMEQGGEQTEEIARETMPWLLDAAQRSDTAADPTQKDDSPGSD